MLKYGIFIAYLKYHKYRPAKRPTKWKGGDSFQLPSSVQADKIEATFEKGVLKVVLPKVEEAKKKEIKIKVKANR
jgi:hypothetical protein